MSECYHGHLRHLHECAECGELSGHPDLVARVSPPAPPEGAIRAAAEACALLGLSEAQVNWHPTADEFERLLLSHLGAPANLHLEYARWLRSLASRPGLKPEAKAYMDDAATIAEANAERGEWATSVPMLGAPAKWTKEPKASGYYWVRPTPAHEPNIAQVVMEGDEGAWWTTGTADGLVKDSGFEFCGPLPPPAG